MLKKSLAITVSLLAISCAPKISNFPQYKPAILSKTSFMPGKGDVDTKTYKIVVFNLNEDSNQIAKQANLGSSITANIENVLTRNHLAKLIDRKAAAKLEKEIALAEMNKTGGYKGPQIADYAISGTISNASFTKTFSSATTTVDANGRLVRVPANFNYAGEVSGNIKIYELPSMSVAENFEFSGQTSRTENVQVEGGTSILGIAVVGGQQSKGADRDDNLVRKAGEEAINSVVDNIKNFFAKEGFIVEKRKLDEKSIFKINLGSSDGIKHGDKFDVIGKYNVTNALTGATEVEKRVIAQGRVSDKIDLKSAWVVLNKKDDVNGIRLGDSVKLKYDRSYFKFKSF